MSHLEAKRNWNLYRDSSLSGEGVGRNCRYPVILGSCNHANENSAHSSGRALLTFRCPATRRQPVVTWPSSRLLASADLLQERKVHYCLTKALGIELTCSTSLGWQRGPFRLVNFSRASLDCLPGLVGSDPQAQPRPRGSLRGNLFSIIMLGILFSSERAASECDRLEISVAAEGNAVNPVIWGGNAIDILKTEASCRKALTVELLLHA